MNLKFLFMNSGSRAITITTKMLAFDGATSYGELAEPITFVGDFEIEVEFSFTNKAKLNQLLSGTLRSEDSINIRTETDGTVSFFIYIGTTLNGVYAGSTDYSDGKLHIANLQYTEIDNKFSLYVDDNLEVTKSNIVLTATQNIEFIAHRENRDSHNFDGIIKSATFTDNTTTSNSRVYTLDSGSIVKEVDDLNPSDSTHDLTYNNVTIEDWSNYTYNESSPDCGGGAGWESDEGGDTVCVA